MVHSRIVSCNCRIFDFLMLGSMVSAYRNHKDRTLEPGSSAASRHELRYSGSDGPPFTPEGDMTTVAGYPQGVGADPSSELAAGLDGDDVILGGVNDQQ